MEDRIPTPGQAGRMLITPEDGSPPYYAVLTMADNPTQDGTPLNKETLLQDGTEVQIFGDANNRTVDEAFSGVMYRINLIMQNVANMTLTVTDASGNPLEGVYVNGIFDDNGDTVQTNASGQVIGYVAEGVTTLSISGYADIVDYSEESTAVKGQSYTKTIQVQTLDFLKITSSKSVKFSKNVQQVDITVVGGGGGAGGGYADGTGDERVASGGGGAGGNVTVETSVTFTTNTIYPAVVGYGGSGGADGATGGTGGTSSFLGVLASGGAGGQGSSRTTPGDGGIGNGNGGNGVLSESEYYEYPGNPGTAGTIAGYSSFTDTVFYGGGGGTGCAANSNDSGGGAGGGYGGAGGSTYLGTPDDGSPGQQGFGGGGGSGGAARWRDSGRVGAAGSGGSGCIAIRMHLKTAA